jgi:riboflavin kinase/FMN adenylyltransferase
MRIWKNEAEFDGRAAVAVLGTFDGVHIGHQALIRETVRRAREGDLLSVVCTFDRNPLEVIAPSRAPKPIFPLSENLNRFERLGADCALVLPSQRRSPTCPPKTFCGC